MVSQLHALDGGTTYGLPYDQLLPLAACRQAAAGSGDRRLVVLDSTWMTIALSTWRVRFAVLRPRDCGAPPLLRPRMLVGVLLRVARAAVDSWRYSGSRGGGGSSGSSSGSGSGPPSEQGARTAPGGCVLDGASSPDVAVYALEVAQVVMTLHPASLGRGRQRTQGGGGIGHGAGGSGASGDGASGSGAEGSSGASGSVGISASAAVGTTGSAGSGGSPSEGTVGGAEWHEECGCMDASGAVRAATWLTWAARRRFADTWWRLVVAAVHAELDDEGRARKRAGPKLRTVRNLLGAALAVPYRLESKLDATGGVMQYVTVGAVRMRVACGVTWFFRCPVWRRDELSCCERRVRCRMLKTVCSLASRCNA